MQCQEKSSIYHLKALFIFLRRMDLGTGISYDCWLDERSYPTVPISINVSRIHFSNSDFMEKLIHLLKKYLVPPTYIELEIAESAFFDYKEDLQNKLYALKDKSFKLSINKIYKRPETI